MPEFGGDLGGSSALAAQLPGQSTFGWGERALELGFDLGQELGVRFVVFLLLLLELLYLVQGMGAVLLRRGALVGEQDL